MSSTATERIAFPITEEHYEKVDRALGSPKEKSTCSCARSGTRTTNGGSDEPLCSPPTHEDMGRLYSFLIGLRMTLKQLDDHVEELTEALDSLDHARTSWKDAA